MNVSDSSARIVAAVLSLIDVPAGWNVAKRDSSLAVPVDGNGVLTAEVTNVVQMNPGLPDWKVSVSVMGQTFASCDPEKATIRALYDQARKSVLAITKAALTDALFMDGVAALGVLPVTKSSIGESADAFAFAVDFDIVVTGTDF